MTIVWQPVTVGRVNSAMRKLKMARKLNPYNENATIVLEPWLVQQAIDRLGSRRLTVEEQRTVLAATRTPKNVRWPDWWEITVGGPLQGALRARGDRPAFERSLSETDVGSEAS